MATANIPIPSTIISREQLARRVAELGREITEDLSQLPLTAIVILNGAFIFAADLLREIKHDNIQVNFISASSYWGAFEKSEPTTLSGQPLQLDPSRHLLIIEDIVDTGETLQSITGSLARYQPPSMRTVALLEKRDRRRCKVTVDYVGFRIDKCFVYGYGLDNNNLCRNFPHIEGWQSGA